MDEASGCYLAHERLAIIDPTSGDQPLFNENKDIVVAVGVMFVAAMSLLASLVVVYDRRGPEL